MARAVESQPKTPKRSKGLAKELIKKIKVNIKKKKTVEVPASPPKVGREKYLGPRKQESWEKGWAPDTDLRTGRPLTPYPSTVSDYAVPHVPTKPVPESPYAVPKKPLRKVSSPHYAVPRSHPIPANYDIPKSNRPVTSVTGKHDSTTKTSTKGQSSSKSSLSKKQSRHGVSGIPPPTMAPPPPPGKVPLYWKQRHHGPK